MKKKPEVTAMWFYRKMLRMKATRKTIKDTQKETFKISWTHNEERRFREFDTRRHTEGKTDRVKQRVTYVTVNGRYIRKTNIAKRYKV